MRIDQVLAAVAFSAMVLAQYIVLYFAAATTYSKMPACQRSQDSSIEGFKDWGQGWKMGVCLTTEQVWCRIHPGRHAACDTAECRAEE
eukprot:5088152-Prymnesium_polylepis.1